MLSNGNKIGAIALGGAFLGYQFFIHKLILSGQLTFVTALCIFIPFMFATGVAIALELGWRLALLITAAITIVSLASVSMFGLPSAIIFGLPHLLTNLFLLWFFARTLRKGREPLITSIARRVHGSLKAELETYTRRVTYAWSLFFLLQIALSLGLYFFASAAAWSLFINILNTPLIILMFVCEYFYRILRHRDHQSSIFSGLQFLWCDKSAAKPPKTSQP